MADFAVSSKSVNDQTSVVSVQGFLDANTFEDFDQSLNSLFESSVYNVAVDLTKLEYISSAGAGVLISAMSISREHGGQIVLVGPNEGVQEVFDLLGISQIFKIAPDVEEGLRLIQS